MFRHYQINIPFSEGVWLSAHVDDLRVSDDLCHNLKALCGISISQLISQTFELGMYCKDQESLLRRA